MLKRHNSQEMAPAEAEQRSEPAAASPYIISSVNHSIILIVTVSNKNEIGKVNFITK